MELSPILSDIAVAARHYRSEQLIPKMCGSEQEIFMPKPRMGMGNRPGARAIAAVHSAHWSLLGSWCQPAVFRARTHSHRTPRSDSNYSRAVGIDVPIFTGPTKLSTRQDGSRPKTQFLARNKTTTAIAGMPSTVILAVLECSMRYLRRAIFCEQAQSGRRTKVDSRAPDEGGRTRNVWLARPLPTTCMSLRPHWWVETNMLQAASDP